MDLSFNIQLAQGYKSNSQKARVLTEDWVLHNSYCPNCGKLPLKDFKNGRPVADYFCQSCNEEFELKSKSEKISKTIPDGAYKTMIERIHADNNPNLFVLTYTKQWSVNNFIIIPKQFFTEDIIIKRPPLKPTAKRAGWIGCNINYSKISELGKIFIVKNEQIIDPEEVNKSFNRTMFIREISKEMRGATLEILNCLQLIPKKEFSLNEMYAFESYLKAKFPINNHIKPKIRQQLQVLRDRGIIEFVGRGKYRKL
jgi:type II restriction enzyme